MKNRTNVRLHSSLIATTILILLIVALSFMVSIRVTNLEEQRSLETLYSEAEALIRDINTQIKRDCEQLEMIASIASSFENLRSEMLWEILDSYQLSGMISDFALLLPDGTILSTNGKIIKSDQDFEEIKSKGEHVTDREISLLNGEFILRHYFPIVSDGETIAMLYGVIDLKTLINDLLLSPYDGKASIYIIDANTGDFLLDTWHKNENLGNFWDMGERPVAFGYDSKVFQEELFGGKTGHIVFRSRTIGDYLYYHYQSVGINEWRLALSVPESVVFSYAHQVRRILNFFLALEALAFFLYFLWMFGYVKKETGEKQRQVYALNNIYDVAKLLFGAHEKQDNIKPALGQIAKNTDGSRAIFFAFGENDNGWTYSSTEDISRPDYISFLKGLFLAGERSYECYDENIKAITKGGITSLVAIPIEDENGVLCGILAIENPIKQRDVLTMLRNVSLSFSMLYRNLRVYSNIMVLGETDILTGLLNRNRYERDIIHYKSWYKTSLSCIFIDANGLHELNNTKGHEAGDELLKKIAQAIIKFFGKEYSYRIGGDEFVIFIPDKSLYEVTNSAKEIESYLLKENISIAIGLEWSNSILNISSLVRKAEKRMYSAKKNYYEKQDIEHIRK